jgi:hypothetical protein
VARTKPLGMIKDVTLGTLLHPVGTAGKAVEQAKGTAEIGRLVAGQVARTAASAAVGTVGGIARRAGGSGAADPTPSTPATGRSTRGDEPNLRPVPTVNEPAHTPAPAARRPRKEASPESMKNHGDQLEPVTKAAKKAPAKKTPVKKSAEAPVAKKAPAKKTPAKKAAKKTAGSDTDLTTKKTPAKKLAAEGLDDVTPADVARVAKKTPTKQTTPVTPVAEPTAKKTAEPVPAAGAEDGPRTASEVANEEGPEYTTPVGTTAAGESALPNTDLQQPGTEPLMDPSTVKAVKSEAETMQRAADPDKG